MSSTHWSVTCMAVWCMLFLGCRACMLALRVASLYVPAFAKLEAVLSDSRSSYVYILFIHIYPRRCNEGKEASSA